MDKKFWFNAPGQICCSLSNFGRKAMKHENSAPPGLPETEKPVLLNRTGMSLHFSSQSGLNGRTDIHRIRDVHSMRAVSYYVLRDEVSGKPVAEVLDPDEVPRLIAAYECFAVLKKHNISSPEQLEQFLNQFETITT